MTPGHVTDELDAARAEVLAQYRRHRQLGRSPLAAMTIVRDANAYALADLACYGLTASTRQRHRYIAATEYAQSMWTRPLYWHLRSRRFSNA